MVRRVAWIVMLALVVAAFLAAVPACHSSGRGSSHGHGDGHGDAHRYACPMHPQVTSSNRGSCRICGMPLEHAH